MHMWWELLRCAKGASFLSFPGLLTGSEWHLHLDFDEVEEEERTSSLSFPEFSAAAKIGKKKKNNWNAVGNRWEGTWVVPLLLLIYACSFFFRRCFICTTAGRRGIGRKERGKANNPAFGEPQKELFFSLSTNSFSPQSKYKKRGVSWRFLPKNSNSKFAFSRGQIFGKVWQSWLNAEIKRTFLPTHQGIF